MPSQDAKRASDPGSVGSPGSPERRLSRRSLLQGAATAGAAGLAATAIGAAASPALVLADMLRLNTSIPPTTDPKKQSIYGLLGGDAAGFPNGRRVTDDVVAIELRAIAGVTYALVAKYKPDAAASALTDGLTPANVSSSYLSQFPYLGVPYSGFDNPSS